MHEVGFLPMSALRYTPYDGSRKPFTIGLQPLDMATWFEVDEHLAAYLAEKEALFAEKRDVVFLAEPDTVESQRLIAGLVADHLTAHFPDLYERDGSVVTIVPTGAAVDLAAEGEPPLLQAARLVQEDLCVMRRADDGWRLVAAALCFPSSWSLAEKFGRNLDAIHATVPHYAEQLAVRMSRIFDSLRPEIPAWRMNWSLNPDPNLHHPESKQLPRDRDWTADEDAVASRVFIRVERQTLRKLANGDILFTIKIYVDPLTTLRAHPEGNRLALSLRDQVLSLDASQLAYKALTEHRDRVADALAAIGGLDERLQEPEPA